MNLSEQLRDNLVNMLEAKASLLEKIARMHRNMERGNTKKLKYKLSIYDRYGPGEDLEITREEFEKNSRKSIEETTEMINKKLEEMYVNVLKKYLESEAKQALGSGSNEDMLYQGARLLRSYITRLNQGENRK